MARTAKDKKQTTDKPADRTLVLDVGAHSIKAGFVGGSDATPQAIDCHVIPNCIARSARDKITYVGSQLDGCLDYGELAVRRPVERGYIVNWEGEKAIWESSILYDQHHGLACDPAETNLILTEAPHTPSTLQGHTDQMVFEEFGFANYGKIMGPVLPAYLSGRAADCLLVVDIGHSHTTITPLLAGRPLHSACRRLEIGGKVLTNHLKDLVSSRQFELQKEFFLVEQMKEDVCYVAETPDHFSDLLGRCWKGGMKDRRKVDNSIVVEYVLPDYEAVKRGYIRPHDPSKSKQARLADATQREDYVVLKNERFTVPELLFSPSDIGMHTPGITGMILDSLESLPQGIWQALLANILVVGGTTKLPGLVSRLQAELRQALDERFLVLVKAPDDPLKCIWQGGAQIAASSELMAHFCITKAEYLELGPDRARRLFPKKPKK